MQLRVQGLSESVVVEPYQAAAECIEFSVTVLGTKEGPVVLLPTEAEAFDLEDDIVDAAMDLEAYKARKEVPSSNPTAVGCYNASLRLSAVILFC